MRTPLDPPRSVRTFLRGLERSLNGDNLEGLSDRRKHTFKCWCRLVEWAWKVREAGGWEEAVKECGTQDSRFAGMLPSWDLASLEARAGPGPVRDDRDYRKNEMGLFVAFSILDSCFEEGVLRAELQVLREMDNFVELIKAFKAQEAEEAA